MLKGNAVIGQSGGPTMVINQSLVGAVIEARNHPEITGIYGAVHGIQGVLNEDLIDLKGESPETLEAVARTPSSGLGSVRKKPTPEDCQAIFDVLKIHDVRYLFYIGGNDSAETADILNRLAHGAGYELRVCHIPKTIDNDLLVNDHCPGYGSAARFVAMAFQGDDLDNRSLPGVKINVVMGRHAGFLTAASALGRSRPDDGPHLIYVPERPFDLGRFAEDVKGVVARLKRCVVAVSEGVSDAAGAPVFKSGEVDSHGNVQLSGSGALGDFLAGEIKKRLGISRVRADTLGYMQRSFPGIASEVDSREARDVGRAAVRAVTTEGHRGVTITIHRTGEGRSYASELRVSPLESVAKRTRHLDDKFLTPESNNVTQAFLDYAAPLCGELPTSGRLVGQRVAKKLKKG